MYGYINDNGNEFLQECSSYKNSYKNATHYKAHTGCAVLWGSMQQNPGGEFYYQDEQELNLIEVCISYSVMLPEDYVPVQPNNA